MALRELPAPALRRLVLAVGLEDAGELVALATFDQLREIFDEDLWRSARPGQDEDFDPMRFVAWLEVMLEGGEERLVARLSEFSKDFLVFVFSQLVQVVDVATLTAWSIDRRQADELEALLEAYESEELDGFLLFARRSWGWEAIWTTILGLDRYDARLLREVLELCAQATHETAASAHGLARALRGDERLREEARAAREERRSERGYVSAADARAFLALASKPLEAPEEDGITRAHLRALDPEAAAMSAHARVRSSGDRRSLRRLLVDAGVEWETAPEQASADRLFDCALRELSETDAAAHGRILAQLAYLANVLIAGDRTAIRPARPVEAAERVLEVCEAGLRSVLRSRGPDDSTPRAELDRWGAVGLFRRAWSEVTESSENPSA